MGRGQRHSKNAGVMGSEALSYHERKALGFGTVTERVGKESHGNYNDCCLTLQPVTDPMITPDGYLYSKEAILENLLQQKKAIKRKLGEWEARQKEEEAKSAQLAAVQQEAALIAFDRQNHMGISERTAADIKAALAAEAAAAQQPGHAKGVVNIQEHRERMKEVKAFWLPSQIKNERAAMEKPDEATYCPASGKKLRLKDLTPAKFTRVPEGEQGVYMDPVTRQTFNNASRLVVLKPTGDVMLESTYKKCVAPDGSYAGVRVREKDVVALRTGATGFAAHDGDKVQSKKHWLLGPGSGKADLRGQHKGGASRFGLVFNN